MIMLVHRIHGDDGLGESNMTLVTDVKPIQRDAQAGYAKLLSENEDVWF